MEQNWEIGGEIGRTGSATHEYGRELDWFMVSGAIRGNWSMQKEEDQPFQGHTPREIIVNPKEVDLTTLNNEKEPPTDTTKPAHQTEEGRGTEENAEEWEAWSRKAEEWLLKKLGVHKNSTKEGGKKIGPKRERSPPHNTQKKDTHTTQKAQSCREDCNKQQD